MGTRQLTTLVPQLSDTEAIRELKYRYLNACDAKAARPGRITRRLRRCRRYPAPGV